MTRDVRRPGIYAIGHDASFRARACVCGLGVRSPIATGQLGRAQISVITRVALETGFLDPSHFTATFARAFGVSPRAYRKHAR